MLYSLTFDIGIISKNRRNWHLTRSSFLESHIHITSQGASVLLDAFALVYFVIAKCASPAQRPAASSKCSSLRYPHPMPFPAKFMLPLVRIISLTHAVKRSSTHDVVSVLEKKRGKNHRKTVFTRIRKQGYLCTSHIPDHYIHYFVRVPFVLFFP
jgi:hypothetical protein